MDNKTQQIKCVYWVLVCSLYNVNCVSWKLSLVLGCGTLNLRGSKGLLGVWWVSKEEKEVDASHTSGQYSFLHLVMQHARAADNTMLLFTNSFCLFRLYPTSFSTRWLQPCSRSASVKGSSRSVARRPRGRRQTELTRHYLEIKHSLVYSSSLCRR